MTSELPQKNDRPGLIARLCFFCAVNLLPHPFGTAQPCQLFPLRRRHAQGDRYRFLSLLHGLAALAPSWAASGCHLT